MKILCARLRMAIILVLTLLLTVPAWGHEAQLSRELLEEFFPDAENFVSRKKSLTPHEISQIEKDAGDKLHQTDHVILFYVALGIDSKTGRYTPTGAVLMVDAEGASGLIDLVVGFHIDRSVKRVIISDINGDADVNNETFLRQFAGKSISDKWRPDKDFQLGRNTESSIAVIRAVRRSLYLLQAVMQK